MKIKATAFDFWSYRIQHDQKTLQFDYRIFFPNKQNLFFRETLHLPNEIPRSNSAIINNILFNLHLMLGISYFKMYCPEKIIISSGSLTKKQAYFWETIYTKGLGEFFYKNLLDFRNLVKFPATAENFRLRSRQIGSITNQQKSLIGIGGGKDSIVAAELLKKNKTPLVGFVVYSNSIPTVINEVIKIMKIDCLFVKRQLDQKLLKLNATKEVLNGHIPISAIHAFIAVLLSFSYGYKNIFSANEKSANYGNLKYLGQVINHQWSKSEEFERLFKDYLKKFIYADINYQSILKNLSELEIVKIFCRYPKYFLFFSSCNKNFRIKKFLRQKNLWCGRCPKCLSVFILMAAYLPKKTVLQIFQKNLLNEPKLTPTLKALSGVSGFKPFECVATQQEIKEALNIIRQKKEFSDDYLLKQ